MTVTLLMVIVFIGKVVLATLFVTLVGGLLYIYLLKDYLDYRQAKKEIFVFVKSYKHRCTKQNRFLVTIEYLQDSFREYDTSVIEKVWLDLVNERMIEQDEYDKEWCIK